MYRREVTSALLALSLAIAVFGCTSDDPVAQPSAGGSGAGGGQETGGTAGVMSGGTGGTTGGNGGSGAGGMAGSAPDAAVAHDASMTDDAAADAAPEDGGEDAGVYNPCPSNGEPCRIMPLGDSITDGCCGENTVSMGAGYRLELFRRALDEDKKLTFVGSNASGPPMVDDVSFPRNHEGHSGWTIADGGGRDGLQDQVVGWLQATSPHIITLMIGTNDISIQLELGNAPMRLGTLIDTITMTAPDALLVVAQIVPTQTDDENARAQAYNAAIPALVGERAAAGKHVILVDMYSAYTEHDDYKTALLANDLHPSDAGYAVMASTWWDAIGALLP